MYGEVLKADTNKNRIKKCRVLSKKNLLDRKQISSVLKSVAYPKFPLTIFEHLINVSNSNTLVFGGDGIAHETDESIKKKLCISSSEYFSCPNKDGCTLTVHLKKQIEHAESLGKQYSKDSIQNHPSRTNRKTPSKLAIVAVRILIRAKTDISVILVMGRQVSAYLFEQNMLL